MDRFNEQVAIVAGGARGIGAGIAARLAREGATVYIVDRKRENLQATAYILKERGLSVETAYLDITDEASTQGLMDQVMEQQGRIDILVNSAGIVGLTSTKITDYDSATFNDVLAVNLTGAFLLTRYVIPHMLSRNYGRILHITSIGGKEGNPGMVGYAASKSGLMGLVKGVGKEYADKGITVNGIAPAVIATPMNQDTAPEMLEYMTAKIPMKRLGTVEEVAAMACWIVSPEASFNTGFIFDLSGGRATY